MKNNSFIGSLKSVGSKVKKRINQYISARFFITLGLVSLVVSTLLGAFFIGLIPDKAAIQRDNRASLSELATLALMPSVGAGDVQDMQATLKFIAGRNTELESIGIRTLSGVLMAQHGLHQATWQYQNNTESTDKQVVVPLIANGAQWGQVELQFKPVTDLRWWLILAVALSCSLSFYLYLGKMLRNLDPSKAVPERVRNALDTLAEGLLVVDVDSNIVLANSAFANHVGLAAEKIVGRLVGEFGWQDNTGQKQEGEVLPWGATLSDGKAIRGAHISLASASGKRHSFMVNCSPVFGANAKNGAAKVNGMLMSLSDITLLEEKEIELLESKKAADNANQAKSDFLANMSHEIRTPMNAVLGFTELLRRGQSRDEKEARKHLNTIHSNGKHLLELINDILDLSKVEAGRLEVEKISVQPHRIIAEVVQILQVKATEKNIGLKFVCNGLVPPVVQTDPARLRQVITNLVGNAIKFTDSGQVSIVQRMVNDGAKTKLAISIIDSGVGIPADKIDSIFEAFVQAESSTTRRFGGTGLGLSISKKFALALGGDINVKSELGRGSSFTLTIDPGVLDPRSMVRGELLDLASEAVVDGNTQRWQFEGQTVLVVDDGNENRELVRLVLEEAGLVVEEAENGLIAVQMAKAKQYPLILMDMQMPVMDGYTATQTIRSNGFTGPIVALTAHAMAGFEAKITAVGCTGYLTKPIDIDLLLKTIASILGATKQAVAKSPIKLTAPSRNNTLVVSRLAGHPKLAAVARTFGLKLPGELKKMHRAFEIKSFNELSELAHWLKGAAGSVGYDSFTDPATQLERAAKSNDVVLANEMIVTIQSLSDRLQLPEVIEKIDPAKIDSTKGQPNHSDTVAAL